MIPKIHAKGCSFQGCATYVLHDKDATTSERVAWTETINLGTENPHAAWKVMAATSMDQARLKKEAGIKNTGRKSKDHVQHVTLSWHADEAKELTPDEQIRAAKWFLREIKASDRQAMIVAHNDEPQPHVHLVINRVSPTDGRLLSSSFEKLKSSRWAEKYEKDRGKIFCHQRVINNAARKRGEYVRGKKDTARHVYEAAQKVSNDNSKKKTLLDQHRKKTAAIAKKDRDDKARHKREFAKLLADRKTQIAKFKEQIKYNIERERQKVRDGFKARWEKQHFNQQADIRKFEANEKTLKGRMKNALQLVEWRKLVGGRKIGEKTTLSDAFRIFSKEGERKIALKRQIAKQEQNLRKEQLNKEKNAASKAKTKGKEKIAASRRLFERERHSMILKHQLERAKSKAQWRGHDQQQREAWLQLNQKQKRERFSSTRHVRTANGLSQELQSQADCKDSQTFHSTGTRQPATDKYKVDRASGFQSHQQDKQPKTPPPSSQGRGQDNGIER